MHRKLLSRVIAKRRWFNALCLLLFVTLAHDGASAQERDPSREPILRIETGMHTAPITRIGVDRAGKFLVTASDDKTARIWDLQTATLLRVLRVPIGEGNEGKLYAAGISPDGKTIAVAGWTSADGLHEIVYLFDRESGRIRHRLINLPNRVLHLAFSPDGSVLVATLKGKNGVRVWRTSDWGELGRDTAYGDDSYSADFDNKRRLVTSSYDGMLRLYDQEMRLLTKRKAPGGDRPYGVRYSPDGRRVAVGYDDSVKVDVLSGDTLAASYSADSSGIKEGSSLNNVAWSASGTMLFAGGRYQANQHSLRRRRRSAHSSVHSNTSQASLIRVWTDSGRGPYINIPTSRSAIADIAALPTGSIVYAAADPIWGIISSDEGLTSQAAQIVDYREMVGGFSTTEHGDTIGFGYGPGGAFQLSRRSLASRAAITSEIAPRTEATGLAITTWENTYTPRLNRLPVRLESGEMSRSLAISPDGQHFLLGTAYYIRLFNRRGAVLWKTPAPSEAWAVNISGDGRLALAAFGDGTIRWYRMTDGKELLAFFPHIDSKRWILWTPSGYYDASPGSEELIGWHVNNGRDAAADFFPVGQFREAFYRPDVVSLILQTLDEQLAFKQAEESKPLEWNRRRQLDVTKLLPPVVEIISPVDAATVSKTEVTVRFRVRTPSGEPVTNIKTLVDGRPSTGTRELSQVDAEVEGVREIRITIPKHDIEVSIIAENRFAASVPATIRLKWTGATAIAAKSTLYVLAVGVSRYANEKYNLQFADKDARDFVNAMMAQKGLLYSDVVIYHDKALTNESATKDEIEGGLDWIRTKPTSNDVAMVFFSGHGLNDPSNYYFFCPYNIDPAALFRTGVPFSDIKNALGAVKGKVVFFIDSCHSGNSLGMGWRRDMNLLINELSSAQNGVLVISASTSSQLAYEIPDLKLGMLGVPPWNNGAFTKAVIEGINGAAESRRTGRITFASLVDYVTDRVLELTNNHQSPSLGAQGGQNLAIAIKR